MSKLFECCHKCKPPKRSPTCHGTCSEYLADRAELDRLNDIREQDRIGDMYAIDAVLGSKDTIAKRCRRPNQYGSSQYWKK